MKYVFIGVLFLLALYAVSGILGYVANWKVMKKAGQPGWKSLIPFYSMIEMYKICWNWRPCVVIFGLMAVNFLIGYFKFSGSVFTMFTVISFLVILLIAIEKNHRLSLSFGHGVGFTFGLILLNPVFMLILAFDSSVYLKYEYVEEKEKEEDKKVFAKGFCFTKVFLFFVIGCILGTYWEEFLYFFQHNFAWSSRQGVLYGPFSPIYGVGLAAYVALLGKNNEKRSAWKTFFYSFLLGGGVEYLTSYFSEKFLGASFWDYHDLFLNINGRTTIPYMVVWGAAGILLMKFVYPRISKAIEKIPYSVAQIVYPLFVVFLCIDMFLTASAFVRMNLRDKGGQPVTFYGKFLDWAYPDSYMDDAFPVMGLGAKKAE